MHIHTFSFNTLNYITLHYITFHTALQWFAQHTTWQVPHKVKCTNTSHCITAHMHQTAQMHKHITNTQIHYKFANTLHCTNARSCSTFTLVCWTRCHCVAWYNYTFWRHMSDNLAVVLVISFNTGSKQRPFFVSLSNPWLNVHTVQIWLKVHSVQIWDNFQTFIGWWLSRQGRSIIW